MRDHVQQTIAYLQHGRVPCDADAGKRIVEELMSTMDAFGAALDDPSGTSRWMMPHLLDVKQLFDASLSCPCGGASFGACGNRTIAAQATEGLLKNAVDWSHFLAQNRHRPEPPILQSWNDHLTCTLAYLQAAVDHGTDSSQFKAATTACVDKADEFARAIA
jgi:hypothetical protein